MMHLKLTINTNAIPESNKHQLNKMLGLRPLWGNKHEVSDDKTELVQFMNDRDGFGKLYKFEGKLHQPGEYITDYDADAYLKYIGKMFLKHRYEYFIAYAIIAFQYADSKYSINRM